MVIVRELQRRARLIVGPVLGAALAGYFAYNTVEGDRGLIAWVHKTKQLNAAERALGKVEAKRAALAAQVNAMDPHHIDRDLLDRQVRSILNFAAPGEIVIMRYGPDGRGAAQRP